MADMLPKVLNVLMDRLNPFDVAGMLIAYPLILLQERAVAEKYNRFAKLLFKHCRELTAESRSCGFFSRLELRDRREATRTLENALIFIQRFRPELNYSGGVYEVYKTCPETELILQTTSAREIVKKVIEEEIKGLSAGEMELSHCTIAAMISENKVKFHMCPLA